MADGVEVAGERVAGVDAGRLWAFLWSGRAGSAFRPEGRGPHVSQQLLLLSPDGEQRSGVVVEVGEHEATVRMSPGATAWGMPATSATISVETAGAAGARVLVRERGFTDPASSDQAHDAWERAVRRVTLEARRRHAAAQRPRQAVVVIHGIGSQRPRSTLSGFARSGIVPGVESAIVKPDRVSGSHELRSFLFPADEDSGRPLTEVYEAYWAHLVTGTTLTQVSTWLRQLVLRRGVPRPLVPVVWVARLALLAAVVVAVLVALGRVALPAALTTGGLAALAFAWLRVAGRAVAVDVVGDAARYLRPDADNVAVREAIRREGLALLDGLHETGSYDRVVVVGHSLGAVIAYDLVTLYWIRTHWRRAAGPGESSRALLDIELSASGTRHPDGPLPACDAEAAQAKQFAAWQEARANGQDWLVTDLVTLGAPLAYGSFLMAPDRAAFERDVEDRVLPVAPPVLEPSTGDGGRAAYRCTFEQRLPGPDGKPVEVRLLHHAAPFALTRWTNLWFPSRAWGLRGDLVGGPVAPEFGPWVLDRPLGRRGDFAHTRYWDADLAPADREAIRAALRLDDTEALRAVADARPL